MNERTVYLDNNATTLLHPEVIQELINSFKLYGNPSSMHSFGRESFAGVEWAREQVSSLINADVSGTFGSMACGKCKEETLEFLHEYNYMYGGIKS